jgi:hypothetical protein
VWFNKATIYTKTALNKEGDSIMSRKTGSLSNFYKAVAKYYKAISIVATLIFLPELIKLLIKGVDKTDKVDLLVDLIVYGIFLIAITIIKKKYKD